MKDLLGGIKHLFPTRRRAERFTERASVINESLVSQEGDNERKHSGIEGYNAFVTYQSSAKLENISNRCIHRLKLASVVGDQNVRNAVLPSLYLW